MGHILNSTMRTSRSSSTDMNTIEDQVLTMGTTPTWQEMPNPSNRATSPTASIKQQLQARQSQLKAMEASTLLLRHPFRPEPTILQAMLFKDNRANQRQQSQARV